MYEKKSSSAAGQKLQPRVSSTGRSQIEREASFCPGVVLFKPVSQMFDVAACTLEEQLMSIHTEARQMNGCARHDQPQRIQPRVIPLHGAVAVVCILVLVQGHC